MRYAWTFVFTLAYVTLASGPLAHAQSTPKSATPSAMVAASTMTTAMQQYPRLVADLETSITTWRAATPAFAEFAKVYSEVVIPWAIRGEAARQAPQGSGPSNYNEKSSRPEIQNITGALYKNVYPGFEKLRQGGRIRLTPIEARNFATMLGIVQKHSTLIVNPREYKNPYPEGTPGHAAFERDLGVAVAITAAPLRPLILRLPPELEQKKQAVRDLYLDLTKALPPAEAQKLKPFRDPYLENYVSGLTRIEALDGTALN